MVAGSKQRIESVASDILARRGFNGMGLKALSDAAQLPYGSIYHHFPGGKEQIAASAITAITTMIEQLLDGLFAAEPPDGAVRAMFDYMAGRLAESDWASGCPVGTPAQDGADDSALVRQACRASFATMIGAVARGLERAGVEPEPAHDLATTVVATYEGATMLARVQRSAEPLAAARDAMVTLLHAANATTGQPR
jgi:TetR/AcrR family transcriptional repressor of lmrAB and yxaGH operons